MSNHQPTRSELAARIHQFAQAAIAGELSPDEARLFEDLVVNDSAARDIYTSFILDTVALRDLATEYTGSSAPDLTNAPNSAHPVQAPAIPVAQEGLTTFEPDPYSLRGFFGGLVQSVGLLGRAGRFRLAASLAAIATATVIALVFGIFSLTGGADQSGMVSNQIASSGLDVSSIQLDSGTTRLTLPKVGRIIVEGPAEFELIDPMRARLTSGRIKVRVTEPSGHGFVVETPHGDVTDLGTEFALDVPKQGGDAGLVVFDGAVDLRVKHGKETHDPNHVEHLVQGEGVTFNQSGQLNRIGSIVTGTVATFLREVVPDGQPPLIASVSDNRRSSESKKFYEIVPGGLGEDALAHVDRPHQWNGMTAEGMPTYLQGADYIKTFAEDRLRKHREIKVTLGRPATLYVLFDKRISPPAWLKKDFEPTRDSIGMDLDRWGTKKKRVVEVGPGNSVNARYTVWKRIVKEPGIVVLGPPYDTARTEGGMYGIAAAALDSQPAESKSSTKNASVDRAN